MKTCDTCKWWGEKESLDKRPCLKLSSYESAFGECGVFFQSDYEFIFTGPKFGCAHHESKKLDDMADEALAEHRAGLTEEWPK